MLMPKLFERDLFDDWFDEFGMQKEIDAMNRKLYGRRATRQMLTRNICSEYGSANIQCNGIGPGYIATKQTAPSASMSVTN